ncbi:FAD-dependent oxidoreductase [Pseudarthrobacter sp. MDT3-26]|uniref:FAD-dependent oxidoreductase n=1 Tax=Pseudarthrobacter raffinosi TaxID=2953651 RepID=UPI00208E38A1|nr:FAD-dependent oxidoreductase [Pseudarthrobacter sp. MDT3-26]MCO4263090.1 FAD-dependent oxidoreductase [Pseudarthrobacter sp. MDT3-26]
MPPYDLAIIGSGSGNSLITPFWDDKKVAMIDAGVFGGTCLNVGCIPTKVFVYPATLAAAPREAARLGVDLSLDKVRWNELRDRIFGRIDSISESGRRYRAEELKNVDLYQEHVRFTGPRTLTTDSGVELTTDRVVVAAGSRAVLPDVPGIALPHVHTSDTVMRLDGPPERVVVGGGYIEDNGDGSVTVVFADDDGKPLRVAADIVLMATGRVPNTDRLGVDAAGFDLDEDHTLSVDANLRVLAGGKPVDGVYTLGDIANSYQLKHVANREARVVAHNLEHPDRLRTIDYTAVPFAVFSNPQVASVGLTEDEARSQATAGTDVVTAVQDYGSTAYGWAMEDEEGVVKLVAERSTGCLLGAHIMGHEASLLIQPLIQAMATDVSVHQLAGGPYWIHPALMEVVENALLALDVDVPENAPL